MKNTRLQCVSIMHIVALMLFTSVVYGQDRPPREVITEDSTVSFVKTTPFNIAIKGLNELSIRLDRLVIIDLLQRTSGIGVDIENLRWRAALELIAAANDLTLVESENYIQLAETSAAVQTQPEVPTAVQQVAELKPVSKDLREISIEAKFIEADRKALREFGVNWSIFSEKNNTVIIAGQNVVGDRLPGDIGTLELLSTTNTTSLNALAKALETNDIGKVLANPRITVVDGRTGRVQIGQDFSIKQRDFAGNVIDVFVSSGIILSVTPNIFVEDTLQFIHLITQVERSSANPGAISTIVNKTQAQTELLLNDGEEVGIGGLYLTQEDVTRTGIPLLKDIPKWFFGLGYLFGYERVIKSDKELIILLKAEILPPLEERLLSMEREGTQ